MGRSREGGLCVCVCANLWFPWDCSPFFPFFWGQAAPFLHSRLLPQEPTSLSWHTTPIRFFFRDATFCNHLERCMFYLVKFPYVAGFLTDRERKYWRRNSSLSIRWVIKCSQPRANTLKNTLWKEKHTASRSAWKEILSTYQRFFEKSGILHSLGVSYCAVLHKTGAVAQKR